MIFRQTEEIFDGMCNALVVFKAAVVKAEGLMKVGADNAGGINFISPLAQRPEKINPVCRPSFSFSRVS